MPLFPTGCSRWNPIEHRLFSHISVNWAGIPLRTFETMLSYIAGTVTKAGLKVRAVLKRGGNETGECISDAQICSLNLKADAVCPMWNYTLRPRNGSRQNSHVVYCCRATTASAIVAAVGNEHDFKSSRQFSAWLGLTPGQHSSGGKARLGGITKAGDSYLRSLLVLGARSVLLRAKAKTDPVSRWALQLKERRGYWRAIVAIVAKNARMCWAALKLGEGFKVPA